MVIVCFYIYFNKKKKILGVIIQEITAPMKLKKWILLKFLETYSIRNIVETVFKQSPNLCNENMIFFINVKNLIFEIKGNGVVITRYNT